MSARLRRSAPFTCARQTRLRGCRSLGISGEEKGAQRPGRGRAGTRVGKGREGLVGERLQSERSRDIQRYP